MFSRYTIFKNHIRINKYVGKFYLVNQRVMAFDGFAELFACSEK